jgi:hypothetical protein
MSSLYGDNSVWIKLLHPHYEYPVGVFKHHDALYYPSEEVVFIASKKVSYNYGGDAYSEVAFGHPEEIRLLSTLTLSIPEGFGMVAFGLWHGSKIDELSLDIDLSEDQTVSFCRQKAQKILLENEGENEVRYQLRTITRSEFNVEKKIYEGIDLTNGILIRGLYTLLKCQLLISAEPPYFMEEAFMNVQISTEAVFRLIREAIISSGKNEVKIEDIYNYISANFVNGEGFVDYLKDMYDRWIQTKHPASIFESKWAPFLQADDVYETYGALVSIYRHLIIGEPGGSSACL